jgi:hypothetical protein
MATLPTYADVTDYIGGTLGRFDDNDIQDALDAETEAQAAVCRTTPYTYSLRQALLRRISRALAMKRLPLSMTQGDAEGANQIVPGRDPEVRRLEAPYRKLKVG